MNGGRLARLSRLHRLARLVGGASPFGPGSIYRSSEVASAAPSFIVVNVGQGRNDAGGQQIECAAPAAFADQIKTILDEMPLLDVARLFGEHDYQPYAAVPASGYLQIVKPPEIWTPGATSIGCTITAGHYFEHIGDGIAILGIAAAPTIPVLLAGSGEGFVQTDGDVFYQGDYDEDDEITLTPLAGLTPNTLYAVRLVFLDLSGADPPITDSSMFGSDLCLVRTEAA